MSCIQRGAPKGRMDDVPTRRRYLVAIQACTCGIRLRAAKPCLALIMRTRKCLRAAQTKKSKDVIRFFFSLEAKTTLCENTWLFLPAIRKASCVTAQVSKFHLRGCATTSASNQNAVCKGTEVNDRISTKVSTKAE